MLDPGELSKIRFKETRPAQSTVEKLIKSEAKVLSEFFGKKIDVPKPPPQLFQTLETLRTLNISGFQPHYLPKYVLQESDNLPGWKIKLTPWFWQEVKAERIDKKTRFLREGKVEYNAATLIEAWYLVDGRSKPNFDNGKQMYQDDGYIGSVMQDLRRKASLRKDSHMPDKSRFGASAGEIEQVIAPKVARLIKTQEIMRKLRAIEFNIWGNMFHPEWGQTNTWELLQDKYKINAIKGDCRLIGGNSDYKSYEVVGGLGAVSFIYAEEVGNNIGFRLLVEFPLKS